MLGIDVARSTVERYRVRRRKPPSPTGPAFLTSRAKELVSLDFFTVLAVRLENVAVSCDTCDESSTTTSPTIAAGATTSP